MSDVKRSQLSAMRYAILQGAVNDYSANEWLKAKGIDAHQTILIWETGFAMTQAGGVINDKLVPEYARDDFWNAVLNAGGGVVQHAQALQIQNPMAPTVPMHAAVEVIDPRQFHSLIRQDVGHETIYILKKHDGHTYNNPTLDGVLKSAGGVTVNDLQQAGCTVEISA